MIWMKCSCGCPSGLGNFSPTRPSMCRFPLMLIWHSNQHKAANYLAVKMSSKMSFETFYVTLPPQLSDRKCTKFSSSFQNTLTLHDRVQSWSPVTVLTAAYHKHYLMLWYVHRCEQMRSFAFRCEFWPLPRWSHPVCMRFICITYISDFPINMLKHLAVQSQIFPWGTLYIPRILLLYSKRIQNVPPFMLQHKHCGHVWRPEIYSLRIQIKTWSSSWILPRVCRTVSAFLTKPSKQTGSLSTANKYLSSCWLQSALSLYHPLCLCRSGPEAKQIMWLSSSIDLKHIWTLILIRVCSLLQPTFL